jgi:hypothetical protein
MEVKEKVIVIVNTNPMYGSGIELEFVETHKELKYQKRDAQYIEWLTSVPTEAVAVLCVKTLATPGSELTPQLRLVAEWLARTPR